MIVNFSEQVIDDFLIPSFTLAKGEIVVIELPSGPFFYPLSQAIAKILTSNTVNEGVVINGPLKYAEHPKESTFKDRFFPMSVGKYHNKFANKANPIYKKIYDIDWMTAKVKVNSLSGTARRQLSIYAALSWMDNVIFDLAGVDPKGGQEIYAFIKNIASEGGSAILLDRCDEFKNDCATFIKVKYLGELQIAPVFFHLKFKHRG